MRISPQPQNPRRDLRELCNSVFNDHVTFCGHFPLFQKRFRCRGTALALKDAFHASQQLVSKISIFPNRLQSHVLSFQDLPAPNDIAAKLKRMLLGEDAIYFLLHGSYADNTYTTISDVDDIVILRKEIFSKFEIYKRCHWTLRRINQFFQYIDPLQHHGHWLFTEYDLDCFPVHMMPLIAIQEAIFINHPQPIHIKHLAIKHYKEKYINILNYQIKDIYLLFQKFFNHDVNMFQLKKLISCISLSAPLIFQINGLMLSKSAAIANAAELFDRRNLAVLSWATEVRKKLNPRRYRRFKSAYRLLCPYFDRSFLQFISENFSPKLTPAELDRFSYITRDTVIHFLNFLRMTCNENKK